jgi:hypothetical protein
MSLISKSLRLQILVVFSVAFACYVAFTWHWMLLCDSAIMHYVNFLMAHGFQPYRQITDNNLPGSYMTEWLAMHVFGGGDTGWRLYEYFLSLALIAGLAIIALPYDWVAGVLAGGMFLMLHGKEGPWWTIEREQVMSVLLVLGYAALFSAVRRRQPGWMLGMGFLIAFAASIKPTIAPLGLLLLVLVWFELHRRRTAWLSYILFGLGGMLAATALNVAFLWQHHAWSDFFFTQRVITTYYVALSHLPMAAMLRALIPPFPLLFVAGAALLAFPLRRFNWEQWALLLGAVVGAISFFLQHKGYYHHRYMFVIFLFSLAGIEVMRAIRGQGWRKWLSAFLIVAVLYGFVPYSLRGIERVKKTSDLTLALEGDLTRLGGTQHLQRQVQCLDLVYGCLNALYHLNLVENTGFTGDMIVFDAADSPARGYHRALWWELAQRQPAEVLVLSNEYFQGDNSFSKVEHWPAYARYLSANYTLAVTRWFPDESGPENRTTDPRHEHAYKIFIRNGSPLLRIQLPSGNNRPDGS